MRKLTGKQIRQTWISFFESKGHKYVPGVSLIPEGDKSVLWVNAGVTGLKKYFDGTLIPPCRRIVNVQKSIRTNDIDNVGKTARHHTFFEMLGNFSIGDYFRKEAIEFAYEILTSEKVGFGLDPNKLYATYNPSDLDTVECWIKEGLKEDHLIPLEHNYWEIGEGPCGPNTEVFYDRGEEYDPEHLGIKLLSEEIDNDRYVELWGIVFSQFNAVAGVDRKDYKELPSKNIDTGAGLERIACILQGTETNFETDLFTPIIKGISKIAHKPYEGESKMAYKVIADHIRALAFALSDGAYFSNEGRGYVLRRLLRRALRYGRKIGLEGPFLSSLLPIINQEYGDFYPNLIEKTSSVGKMIAFEEEKFFATLVKGESLLYSLIEGKKEIDGESLFKLYDTYGFPIEMTLEILEEEGVTGDLDGFNKAMEGQKQLSKAAHEDVSSFASQSKDLLAFKTPSEFVYGKTTIESTVTGLFIKGNKVDCLNEEGEVAFAKSVFYAESGGQCSDKGRIYNDNFSAIVIDVSKAPTNQHLCHIVVEYGTLKEGDLVTLEVDRTKRQLTARNHSGTHLLHAALCNVLGSHIDQRGSYVCDEYLRFDFAYPNKLTDEQLTLIEQEVNLKIGEAIKQETLILPIEEAKKIGAEMEFEEKYGDLVRVVTFGDYSKEFCGGTHVENTSDIGCFTIITESSIASGIRRIEAKTSLGAIEELNRQKKIVSSLKEQLSVPDKELLSKVDCINETVKSLNKEISTLKSKLVSLKAASLSPKVINGIAFYTLYQEGYNREDLFALGDELANKENNALIVLIGSQEGKYPLLIRSKGGAEVKAPANVVIKEVAALLDGNGGGNNKTASGSVKSLDKLDLAFKKVEEFLS